MNWNTVDTAHRDNRRVDLWIKYEERGIVQERREVNCIWSITEDGWVVYRPSRNAWVAVETNGWKVTHWIEVVPPAALDSQSSTAVDFDDRLNNLRQTIFENDDHLDDRISRVEKTLEMMKVSVGAFNSLFGAAAHDMKLHTERSDKLERDVAGLQYAVKILMRQDGSHAQEADEERFCSLCGLTEVCDLRDPYGNPICQLDTRTAEA